MNITRQSKSERFHSPAASLALSGVVALIGLIFAFGLMTEVARAADPAPVNPPGPLPLFLSDSEGNRYDVFTPEEGGSILDPEYAFTAQSGDVPSATIVGVRMNEGAEASNLGMSHHRYTIGGRYYIVDAVDEDGRKPDPAFILRNPAEACVPMPMEFLANFVDARLIATDEGGVTQTVLNSGTRIVEGVLKVCGHVGSVPTILVAGLEGQPGPAAPTPAVELPNTGGFEPGGNVGWLVLILGTAVLGIGSLVARYASIRRE